LAGTEEVRDGVMHREWPGPSAIAVELWSLPMLGHGYPVGTRVVPPGRFMLQAPVDATDAIARFFHLT
jgi:poly(3-hydroxybutyrate) depolymerase